MLLEAAQAIYSPIFKTTIDGAEDVANVTGFDDLIEAEEASEITTKQLVKWCKHLAWNITDESMKGWNCVTVRRQVFVKSAWKLELVQPVGTSIN